METEFPLADPSICGSTPDKSPYRTGGFVEFQVSGNGVYRDLANLAECFEPRQLWSLFRRLFASRLFAKYRCIAKNNIPAATINTTREIPSMTFLATMTIAAVRRDSQYDVVRILVSSPPKFPITALLRHVDYFRMARDTTRIRTTPSSVVSAIA
jgi:hypothetical protein